LLADVDGFYFKKFSYERKAVVRGSYVQGIFVRRVSQIAYGIVLDL